MNYDDIERIIEDRYFFDDEFQYQVDCHDAVIMGRACPIDCGENYKQYYDDVEGLEWIVKSEV